jgi:hypothetical protein
VYLREAAGILAENVQSDCSESPLYEIEAENEIEASRGFAAVGFLKTLHK